LRISYGFAPAVKMDGAAAVLPQGAFSVRPAYVRGVAVRTLALSSVALLAAACSVSIGDLPTAGSVSIAPTPSSIGAGYHQAYSLTVHDTAGKLVPDATGVFKISPDGSCKANVCTASLRGVHVVTATSGGLSAFADLNVTPGGFDHLGVLPRTLQLTAGSPTTFTAVGANSFGDPISDLTATATFAISFEGSCAANVCTAYRAHGGQILTVAQGDHISRFVLQVNAGKMTTIRLAPPNATVVAGSPQTYSATGYDAYNNYTQNAYGGTNFAGADKATLTITPDGSCARPSCTPAFPGLHTVTITFSGVIATTSLNAV
jgi:hypothetical protein